MSSRLVNMLLEDRHNFLVRGITTPRDEKEGETIVELRRRQQNVIRRLFPVEEIEHSADPTQMLEEVSAMKRAIWNFDFFNDEIMPSGDLAGNEITPKIESEPENVDKE